MGKVDVLRLVGENLHFAASDVVALLEAGERLGGLATEAEFGAKVGPVDFEGSRTLLEVMLAAVQKKRRAVRRIARVSVGISYHKVHQWMQICLARHLYIPERPL